MNTAYMRVYLDDETSHSGQAMFENGGVWCIDGHGNKRWYPGHRISVVVIMHHLEKQ